MRRAALSAALWSALACGDSRGVPRVDDAAGELSTRTAVVPVRPESATAGLPTLELPLAGACLAGDPERTDGWRLVGLDGVVDIALEPFGMLASRDSVRLSARLTRTADALPNDTTSADFRGLPVSIHSAWRLIVAPGDTVFAATAVRRLPIESAPLEEQTTLLAHPVTVPTLRDPLRAVWSARAVGSEGALAPREPVKAWRDTLGILVLLARDDEGTPRGELLSRRAEVWRLVWEGPLRTCPGAP